MKGISDVLKLVLALGFGLLVLLIMMGFFMAFNPQLESGGWVVTLVRAIAELLKPRI